MTSEIRIRRRVRLPAEQRRQQIIDAAAAIIAERGYWGLSVQDVADSCALTVNGVLHHVGSKDGLLVAVLDQRDHQGLLTLAAGLGIELPVEGATPQDLSVRARERGIGLRAMCATIVAQNVTQPEIVRLYSVLEAESLSPDHPAHDYFTDRQRVALDGFERLAPDGVDGRVLAQHLLAVMDGLQLQWLRDPQRDLVAEWDGIAAGLTGLL
ncbi:MAG TPA: helix-turn-helix domain-containing protein [Cellulomonas sp.]